MSEKSQEIGVLEGDLEIGRVILQDEVRLYRAQAVLVYLDSPSYDLKSAEIVILDQSITPVVSEDGRRLGFASVRIEHGRILADISIEYASEERLLAETQQEFLFARPFGTLSVPPLPLFDFGAPLPVTCFSVDGIVLSRKPPSDLRISAFGKVVI